MSPMCVSAHTSIAGTWVIILCLGGTWDSIGKEWVVGGCVCVCIYRG